MNDASLTVPEPEEPLSRHQQALVDVSTVLDQRQIARLPEGYQAAPAAGFDPRLAYELALQMDEPKNVFAKYGYDEAQATALLRLPAFITTLRTYRDEIIAKGASFKLKARVQAEDLLTHSYEIATDPETPPSVRADLIKWTAAVADLGPSKQEKEGGGGAASAEFTLSITFKGEPAPGAAGRPAIDVTPTREGD